MTEVAAHPAKFSGPVLDAVLPWLDNGDRVLDPFAGVGGVHALRDEVPYLDTVGIELEPEWALASPYTLTGDCLQVMSMMLTGSFDVVVTSPCYGNRMADSHVQGEGDTSERITYTHKLGRQLTAGSSGSMQFGPEYQAFHAAVWSEVARLVRPGGLLLLNISNHIRSGLEVGVTGWHVSTLLADGGRWNLKKVVPIETRRMRKGQNGSLRVRNEWLCVLTRQDVG